MQQVQYFFRAGHVPIIAVIVEDSVAKWQVLTTGSVRRWNDVDSKWTAIHSLSEDAMAGLRLKARDILMDAIGDGVIARNSF